jgi:hypothetical protein
MTRDLKTQEMKNPEHCIRGTDENKGRLFWEPDALTLATNRNEGTGQRRVIHVTE